MALGAVKAAIPREVDITRAPAGAVDAETPLATRRTNAATAAASARRFFEAAWVVLVVVPAEAWRGAVIARKSDDDWPAAACRRVAVDLASVDNGADEAVTRRAARRARRADPAAFARRRRRWAATGTIDATGCGWAEMRFAFDLASAAAGAELVGIGIVTPFEIDAGGAVDAEIAWAERALRKATIAEIAWAVTNWTAVLNMVAMGAVVAFRRMAMSRRIDAGGAVAAARGFRADIVLDDTVGAEAASGFAEEEARDGTGEEDAAEIFELKRERVAATSALARMVVLLLDWRTIEATAEIADERGFEVERESALVGAVAAAGNFLTLRMSAATGDGGTAPTGLESSFLKEETGADVADEEAERLRGGLSAVAIG